MALFKILKGNSSRISVDITPFHDGYAYFTPDDGGFYIDTEVNGEQKRIRINPNDESLSFEVSTSLLADGWISGKQTITVDGITEDTNGIVGIAQDISSYENEAAKKADLYVYGQGNGTLTIGSFGNVPTCDIPIVIILFR